MRIDIPAAAWVRPPARHERDIVIGVVTRDVHVRDLDGDFRELAVLETRGRVYRIRGEDPDGALYLQIGDGLTVDDHVKFVPGLLDNALPSEQCHDLLRRTMWEHRDRFDDRWGQKWHEELKPFTGMRLRDLFKDEFQIDLQLPWLNDLVLIDGILHRRIEQPLIMVGDFDGGWELASGWDNRPQGGVLCYSLSEVEAARKAARSLSRDFGTTYDASLRRLVRSSQLETSAADYRYALFCERFCHALKQVRGWTIDGAMEFVQTLKVEDRELLLRVVAVEDLTASKRADFDFVQVGSELIFMDEGNPLAAIREWPSFRALTAILLSEGPPSVSLDKIVPLFS